MICQNCGKNNANLKYTQVINGDKMEFCLCNICAEELNINFKFDFNMNDIFSSFLDEFTDVKTFSVLENSKCQNCGLTYEEFSKTGMLGCSKCYDVFESKLDNILKKMHGNNRHTKNLNESKIEVNNVSFELKKLKEELNTCIKNEEYEKAAVLRDKIKSLEK